MTTGITRNELAELVEEMRTSQKTFFRDRTQEGLLRSKELERRVDATVRLIRDKQPPLF